MKYQSQRVAYYFFAVALLLLCLQIVYGFIMAFAHMGYDVLHDYIPFNTARASHNNLLVVWLLCGFMGAAYFIIPDEAGRELFSPTLALIQLAGLVVVGVIAIAGFHVNWWEGRKFLEIGLRQALQSDPARALSEAKRARIRAGGAGAHPYAWAPFVLWGLP